VIIKGSASGRAQHFAEYLTAQGQNERVRIVEIRGVAADNVADAVLEMDAHGAGTRAQKPLYHAHINNRAHERMTDEQRAYAVDRLEKELGLTGQPRVVVVHEKKGREHCHIVWSRIDLEHGVAISDSHNYVRHEIVARELERKFGFDRVQGAHAERDGRVRPNRTADRAEIQQAERLGIPRTETMQLVTTLWCSADNGQAFATALEDQGWLLARGDRRDFVVVDPKGGIHSLARCVEGAKAKDIRARLIDLDPTQLPSVAEAKMVQEDRALGLIPDRDHRKWEDKLLAAGLAKAERDEKGMLRIPEAFVARDLAWHQKQAERPYTATEKRVMECYEASRTDQEFADKLGKAGLRLAVATAGDLEHLSTERAAAFASGGMGERLRLPPQLRKGELVVVDRYGQIHRLNAHKIDVAALEKRFTQGVGRSPGGIMEARRDALLHAVPAKQARAPELQRASSSETRFAISRGLTARAADGPGRAATGLFDSFANIVERGFSGQPAQSDRAREEAEQVPQDSEQQVQHQASVEALLRSAQQRREALLREFGREIPNEHEADIERGHERDRKLDSRRERSR